VSLGNRVVHPHDANVRPHADQSVPTTATDRTAPTLTSRIATIDASAPAQAIGVAPPVLLTTEQAAEYLQVSVRTIKNLMGDGRLAFVKIGRATRIHRHDLDEYIARNRRKQRQPARRVS
jgi:excisionase family DNA binding protein